MPKYVVKTPIEKADVMYLPAGATTLKQMPSACHGKMIPVDAGGFIELTEEEAALLVHGQVPTHDGKPDPVNGAEFRAKKASEQAQTEVANAEAQRKEFEEFQAFKAAKAAKTSTDDADSTDEAPDAPTIKCVALKDFQFKGEKYRTGEERELTFATIRAMGKERVKVLDVDAYEAAKKEKK